MAHNSTIGHPILELQAVSNQGVILLLRNLHAEYVFQMTSQRPVEYYARIPLVFHVFHGIRRIPTSKNTPKTHVFRKQISSLREFRM